jgi:hypothetical protein
MQESAIQRPGAETLPGGAGKRTITGNDQCKSCRGEGQVVATVDDRFTFVPCAEPLCAGVAAHTATTHRGPQGVLTVEVDHTAVVHATPNPPTTGPGSVWAARFELPRWAASTTDGTSIAEDLPWSEDAVTAVLTHHFTTASTPGSSADTDTSTADRPAAGPQAAPACPLEDAVPASLAAVEDVRHTTFPPASGGSCTPDPDRTDPGTAPAPAPAVAPPPPCQEGLPA